MTALEAPVQPGDVLAGKYRVEKILGRGGMGVVVSAFHLELEQRVALKFLLPNAAKRPEVIARFSREARALARIRSEHVARVMDVSALEDGTPYIMMEHLEGRDLSEVLSRDGPLSIPVTIGYILQACVALAEAHTVGIVHRDLKPSNLFLARQPDGTEIVKVLDFGIAKMPLNEAEEASEAGVVTATTDMFGSPRYMSPEQLKSFRDVDARADLWALGVIFYESVTGVSPFRKETMGEVLWAVAFDEPPLLHEVQASVPEALSRIIARCLQKDPAQRYPNAAELAQALLPFGSGDAVALSERAARMLRRAGMSLGSTLTGTEDSLPLGLKRGGSPGAPPGAPQTSPSAEGGTTITRAVTIGDAPRSRPGVAQRPGGRRRVVALAAVLALVAVAGAGILILSRLRAAPPLADATKEASSSARASSPAQAAPPPIESATPPAASVALVPSAAPAAAATASASASATAAPPKGKPPARRVQPTPGEHPPAAKPHEFGDRR